MGYIANETSDLADFSQAVISIWFRIPQAAIDAAITQYEAIPLSGGTLTDMNLPGIIPLVTFGVPGTLTGYPGSSTSRCFIGVACGHIKNFDMVDEEPLPPPRLMAYLQYTSGEASLPEGTHCPDFFQVGTQPGVFINDGELQDGQHITVSADVWHHALISFDLSGGCEVSYDGVGATSISFDTPCQFWWAFDDVNYHTEYLWPSNPNCYTDETGGANDIYSQGMFSVSPTNTPRTFAAGDLPVNGNPFGIPASSADESHVYNTIMAEVQIFTGVTLDTGDEDNRRLFISSSGSPVSPTLASAFFDKDPEIYFRTHTDFITGNNRGSAGDFTPTGTINPFSPGP